MKAWLPIFAVLVLLPITAVGSAKPAKPSSPDLVLSSIMGTTLNPPVYFPAGSHVDSVYMWTGSDQTVKGQQLVTYHVFSPLSWQATYQYYRAKYKGDKVRWQGLFKGGKSGSSYLFFVQEDHVGKFFTMFSVQQDARVSRPDIDPVSEKYKHSTFLIVGVSIPVSRVNDFQKKNDCIDFPMPS